MFKRIITIKNISETERVSLLETVDRVGKEHNVDVIVESTPSEVKIRFRGDKSLVREAIHAIKLAQNKIHKKIIDLKRTNLSFKRAERNAV